MQVPFSVCCKDVLRESPTYDLQSDARRVLHVLDLHLQVVLPRVFSLSLADEEDGVHVAVPHAGKRAAQRLALFAPCHLGPWFALFWGMLRFVKVQSSWLLD